MSDSDKPDGLLGVVLSYASAFSKVGVVALLFGALYWVTYELIPQYQAQVHEAKQEHKSLVIECRQERTTTLQSFREELAAERAVFKATLQDERKYQEANTTALRDLTMELRQLNRSAGANR